MNFSAPRCSQPGLEFRGPIFADGKLHRFKVEGDKNRNSWFVFHPGSPAAGAFGCWKRGFKETWHGSSRDLSQAEWNEVRRLWQQAEREREEAERERHAQARKTATWIIARSKSVTKHPYLEHKGVTRCGDVCEYRGALALPLRDVSGELNSLQFISADGEKRFLTGGKNRRLFLHHLRSAERGARNLRGLRDRSEHPRSYWLRCCMRDELRKSFGRLEKHCAKKFPTREIIVATDNDQFTAGNPGTDGGDSSRPRHQSQNCHAGFLRFNR
jgi:putative DNA primase/helicase